MVVFGSLVPGAKQQPISDVYSIRELLGTGKFSVVKAAVEKKTNLRYAVKIMKRQVVQDNNLVREVEIMRQLRHPTIIGLKDIYESDSELILVLELVTGGELFDRIVERISYTEADAAVLVKHIADVIQYLHSKDIVHCDLKPENLLYADQSEDAAIKLCDFGLSQTLQSGSVLFSIVGTPTYMAPEIRSCAGYGKPVDMWALGVIVYILLCGFPPFDDTSGYDVDFPSPEWDDVSDSAKDFIMKLLVVDPAKRLTANQVMSHLWVSGGSVGKRSLAGALNTMRDFNTCRKTGTMFRSPRGRTSVLHIFEGMESPGSSTAVGSPSTDSPSSPFVHSARNVKDDDDDDDEVVRTPSGKDKDSRKKSPSAHAESTPTTDQLVRLPSFNDSQLLSGLNSLAGFSPAEGAPMSGIHDILDSQVSPKKDSTRSKMERDLQDTLTNLIDERARVKQFQETIEQLQEKLEVKTAVQTQLRRDSRQMKEGVKRVSRMLSENGKIDKELKNKLSQELDHLLKVNSDEKIDDTQADAKLKQELERERTARQKAESDAAQARTLKQEVEREKAARVKLEESLKKMEGELAHARTKLDKYREEKHKYKKDNKKLQNDLHELRSSKEHKPERRGSLTLKPIHSFESQKRSDLDDRGSDDSDGKRKMTHSNSSDEFGPRGEDDSNGTSSDGTEKSDRRKQKNSMRAIKDSLKKMMQT